MSREPGRAGESGSAFLFHFGLLSPRSARASASGVRRAPQLPRRQPDAVSLGGHGGGRRGRRCDGGPGGRGRESARGAATAGVREETEFINGCQRFLAQRF